MVSIKEKQLEKEKNKKKNNADFEVSRREARREVRRKEGRNFFFMSSRKRNAILLLYADRIA